MTEPVSEWEDPEQSAGEEIEFPWEDPGQTDWPADPGGVDTLAASWKVVPSLQHLLAELDAVAPQRDRTSDGSIGDTSHSARPSGHNPDETGSPEDFDADSVNEVRARDFDKDLNRPGLTMEMVAQHLVQQCRAGRITWIKYIIFNRRIWSASNGWVTRTYNGANPHDKHMHVSAKPDTASENDTRPLGLDDLVEDDVTKAEFISWMTEWARSANGRAAIGSAVLGHDPGRSATGATGPAVPDPDAPPFNARDPKTYGPGVGTIGIGSALNRLMGRADAERREVPPTAQQNAAAVVAALSNGTPKEAAEALRSVLGEQAPEVGRLLVAAE